MPAERIPQADDSLLARPLGFVTRLVVRIPLAVLVAALALALAALLLTGSRLGFRTSRLDLLNPESGYNKLWIDYIEEFGDEDDAVVVVEGPSPDKVVPVLQELSALLAREDKLFHAVLHEVDLSKIRAKGLHYLSLEELREIEQFLNEVEPNLRGDWSGLNLGTRIAGINDRLARSAAASNPQAAAAARAELARLVDSLLASLAERGRYRSPWYEMNDRITTLSQVGSEYLLTNEGRLGFVLLRLSGGKDQFARGSESIDELRQLIAQVQSHHPDVKIGLTGLPVMENDEMRVSQRGMIEASMLSLFGVGCLFVAGFGGLRHPLVTIGALLVAIAWSFGYITIAVGHLNILSVSFGVILIGLGIDFGIHYVARYLQIRRSVRKSDQALVATAVSVGPGIVTGGVTTAIAFFMAALTDFTGIAELGIIAGGGILLCVVVMLLVLPAMIHLVDRHRTAEPMPDPLHVDSWVTPLLRLPRVTLLLALVLTVLVSVGNVRLRYDHNLLNLQPVGLESVELERKLLAETDQSVWYALSIAETRDELLQRKKRFLKLDSVYRTEEIVSLLPTDHEAKQPVIARIGARLASLPERPPLIPVAEPERLGRDLAAAQSLLAGGDGPSQTTRWQLEQIRDILRRMSPSQCYARLSDYQQRTAGDLLSRLHALQSMANPEPPKLTDLPESLVTRFVGKSNRYLLKIYGRGNIWDMDALAKFVHDVKGVDPKATGKPLQTYYASRQMQRSYVYSAIYALLAVMIVLLLDFRSVRLAMLALLPVGLGTLQMFGLLGLLDIPLNPANMIVLPLILGIGVDDGIHVVHDFRHQKGRYRLSSSTATAVLLTSLTTMVGFGSLMVAAHRGLQSLGRVLTIGVSCCLVSSIIILPALLGWISRRRAESTSTADPPEKPTRRARPTPNRRIDSPHEPELSPRGTGLREPRASRDYS